MAAMEPSSSNTTPPPSNPADPYIGSKLSVTSKSGIRYVGILETLDVQESTIGLKDVKSLGTEGRPTGGAQVLPSEKVYEYILFRASDIKDLQVMAAATAQREEPLNDPAIIQTNFSGEPSSSPVSARNATFTGVNMYGEPSNLKTMSYPSLSPLSYSGSQLGSSSSSYSTPSSMSSIGMPPQWQGYGAPGSLTSAQRQSLHSNTGFYPAQNQPSATTAVSSISSHASPAHVLSTVTPGPTSQQLSAPITAPFSSMLPPFHSSNSYSHASPAQILATSSSSYLATAPARASQQLSMPHTASFALTLPSFRSPTLMNSTNGLAMPFQSTYKPGSSNEAPVADNLLHNPLSTLPAQSSPYSSSFISEQVPEPLLLQQPTLLTSNQFSQPRLPEYSSSNSQYVEQINGGTTLPSTTTTPAVQPPLLPLPPTSQKLQCSSEFSEEFDFQAMNEKFKKDEVWGHLGKTNHRDEMQENVTGRLDAGLRNPGLEPTGETKPAYNKDDFFDTISCNVVGRGARSGLDPSSERIKLNSETFGNFQQRTQTGFDGYGPRRGYHRGQNYRGRGFNYRNAGRGGYLPPR